MKSTPQKCAKTLAFTFGACHVLLVTYGLLLTSLRYFFVGGKSRQSSAFPQFIAIMYFYLRAPFALPDLRSNLLLKLVLSINDITNNCIQF